MSPEPGPKDKAIADLTAALTEATEKLAKQDELLKELSKIPAMLGRVTAVLAPVKGQPQRFVLNGSLLVEKPSNIKDVQLGDWLQIAQAGDGGLAVVDIITVPPHPAMVMKIAEIMPDGRKFLEMGGNLVPIRKCDIPVEVGDRVLLGGDGPLDAIVMENFGKEKSTYQYSDELNVTWDDVGGQAAAKAAMREAIEYPVLYADLYKSLGKRPIKGVLLEGPAGCGKTLLARVSANALSKLHGKSAKATGYIYVKGPEVLSKWVGEAESTIRSLFKMAQDHKKKNGYPAVIFIDECEALLSKRGTGVSSDMEKTIVPSFLAEMDGMSDSGAMVILATNRPERLDPAVVRDGRVDRRIRVARPNHEDSVEIFQIHLQHVPSARKSAKSLAEHGADQLFSKRYGLYQVDVGIGERLLFTLGHIVSGAMIAGIVDRATSIVLRDAVATKKRGEHITFGPEHLTEAISDLHTELYNVDHSDDIKVMAEPHGGKVYNVARVAR